MTGSRARAHTDRGYAREAARKGIHLTSAAVPVLLATGLARRLAVAVLAALLAIALGVEIGRRMSPVLEARFESLFAPLLRARERTHVTGATWLLGAMLAAVAALPRGAAIAATWAAAGGDASAALIGMRFGYHRLTMSGKSLEGSIACMIVTSLGAFFLARMSTAEAVTLGIVAALAELAPWPGDDNARVVTLVGVIALLWSLVSY